MSFYQKVNNIVEERSKKNLSFGFFNILVIDNASEQLYLIMDSLELLSKKYYWKINKTFSLSGYLLSHEEKIISLLRESRLLSKMDIIFCDQEMKTTGIEVLGFLQPHCPYSKRCLYTGHAWSELMKLAKGKSGPHPSKEINYVILKTDKGVNLEDLEKLCISLYKSKCQNSPEVQAFLEKVKEMSAEDIKNTKLIINNQEYLGSEIIPEFNKENFNFDKIIKNYLCSFHLSLAFSKAFNTHGIATLTHPGSHTSPLHNGFIRSREQLRQSCVGQTNNISKSLASVIDLEKRENTKYPFEKIKKLLDKLNDLENSLKSKNVNEWPKPDSDLFQIDSMKNCKDNKVWTNKINKIRNRIFQKTTKDVEKLMNAINKEIKNKIGIEIKKNEMLSANFKVFFPVGFFLKEELSKFLKEIILRKPKYVGEIYWGLYAQKFAINERIGIGDRHSILFFSQVGEFDIKDAFDSDDPGVVAYKTKEIMPLTYDFCDFYIYSRGNLWDIKRNEPSSYEMLYPGFNDLIKNYGATWILEFRNIYDVNSKKYEYAKKKGIFEEKM